MGFFLKKENIAVDMRSPKSRFFLEITVKKKKRKEKGTQVKRREPSHRRHEGQQGGLKNRF